MVTTKEIKILMVMVMTMTTMMIFRMIQNPFTFHREGCQHDNENNDLHIPEAAGKMKRCQQSY